MSRVLDMGRGSMHPFKPGASFRVWNATQDALNIACIPPDNRKTRAAAFLPLPINIGEHRPFADPPSA